MSTIRLVIYAALASGLAMGAFWLYSAGKESVVSDLKDKRITILQDGAKVDEKVFRADKDSLYCMLVDCADGVQSDGKVK